MTMDALMIFLDIMFVILMVLEILLAGVCMLISMALTIFGR